MDDKRIEGMTRMSHVSIREAILYDACASLALEGERYALLIRTSEKGPVARDRLVAAARRVVEAEEARLDPNS